MLNRKHQSSCGCWQWLFSAGTKGVLIEAWGKVAYQRTNPGATLSAAVCPPG